MAMAYGQNSSVIRREIDNVYLPSRYVSEPVCLIILNLGRVVKLTFPVGRGISANNCSRWGQCVGLGFKRYGVKVDDQNEADNGIVGHIGSGSLCAGYFLGLGYESIVRGGHLERLHAV